MSMQGRTSTRRFQATSNRVLHYLLLLMLTIAISLPAAILPAATPVAASPSAPTLVSPPNGYATNVTTVDLKWNAPAGAISYDLFTGQFGPEKAVDVKLAIDLSELRNIYEVAIIVSGDQDYVPAVQVVKDHGKRVINVAFEGRNGRLLPGGARRLNQITDSALIIKYNDLKKYLGL